MSFYTVYVYIWITVIRPSATLIMLSFVLHWAHLTTSLCIRAYRQALCTCGENVKDLDQRGFEGPTGVFKSATNSLDEYMDTVMFCINFIPSHTRGVGIMTSPGSLRHSDSSGKRNRLLLNVETKKNTKQLNTDLANTVRHVKSLFGAKIISQLQAKSLHSVNNLCLANSLNDFYCLFEREWERPDTPIPPLCSQRYATASPLLHHQYQPHSFVTKATSTSCTSPTPPD
ncbi:hypothetical protein AMECASPLE_033992 [Ameca splendens]|uniref:Uncharacterized protein n=1 Tax=Ameca splendens TaxID=208324 RepID=A0ABV0XW03_9TELE